MAGVAGKWPERWPNDHGYRWNLGLVPHGFSVRFFVPNTKTKLEIGHEDKNREITCIPKAYQTSEKRGIRRNSLVLHRGEEKEEERADKVTMVLLSTSSRWCGRVWVGAHGWKSERWSFETEKRDRDRELCRREEED